MLKINKFLLNLVPILVLSPHPPDATLIADCYFFCNENALLRRWMDSLTFSKDFRRKSPTGILDVSTLRAIDYLKQICLPPEDTT